MVALTVLGILAAVIILTKVLRWYVDTHPEDSDEIGE